MTIVELPTPVTALSEAWDPEFEPHLGQGYMCVTVLWRWRGIAAGRSTLQGVRPNSQFQKLIHNFSRSAGLRIAVI
jgi:hypothetical protein